MLEEVASPVFWPNGPERRSWRARFIPGDQLRLLVRLVVEIKAEKQELTVVVRPDQANAKNTFRSAPPVAALPGAKETDSTQAGAAWTFEWVGIVLAQIEPGALRRGLG